MAASIGEDVLVFVVDATMCFIHNNQIKMPRRKQPIALFVAGGVDAVHHGLIGGEHRAGVGLLLALGEIAQGEIGQLVVERPLGLRYQRVAVSKEQQVFHPAVADQHIGQRNHRAGLAAAGGHHQQRLAAVALTKGVAYGLYGFLLVIAVRYIIIDLYCLELRAVTHDIEQLFQIPLGVNARNLPLRVILDRKSVV